MKTQEDHKDKDRAEYYSYETDFTTNKISESDLFNRYFFILDKVSKKLKISKLSEKYALRRYKRIIEENIIDENTNKIIGKKRRGNIITVPQSMQKEEFDKKKKWISERSYNTRLIERKIENVDHTDIMEIEKEKEIEEEERKRNIDKEQEENNEEENENEDGEDIYNQNEQQYEENEEANNEDYEGDNNDNNNNEDDDQQQKEESYNENEGENEENNNNKEEENENKNEEENNEEKEYDEIDDEKDEDIFE